MANRDHFDHDILARQERMLRLAERDYDLTPAVLEAETGIPAGTLRTYRRDTMMPMAAFVRLCRVIPDELTTLMVEPADKHIGTDPEGDPDLDTVAVEAGELVNLHSRARHPKSPGGVTIVPQEAILIQAQAARVAVSARRAA